MTKITLEQANRLLEQGGTEIALRILTQNGYLWRAEGKPIREEDISEYPRLD
jgi:hypothetical protein